MRKYLQIKYSTENKIQDHKKNQEKEETKLCKIQAKKQKGNINKYQVKDLDQ